MSIIAAASFFGASAGGGGGAQLFNGSYYDSNAGSSYCGIRFNTDGTLTNTLSLGNVALVNWWTPTTTNIGSNYEVKCTLSSGSFTVGTSGSWFAISSNREYAVSTAVSNKVATFNCDIRRISDAVVVASAIFTIEADSGL